MPKMACVRRLTGTVEMENWTTPEKDITICGANENAVLKFAGYYGKENVWLSLQGDLTVENLTWHSPSSNTHKRMAERRFLLLFLQTAIRFT